MSDQHLDALLSSSLDKTTAKLSFANAIVVAQRAGIDVAEIARLTRLPVAEVRAVLRTPY
jgi:hypothetical protein